jgi:hypothetical protein
LATNKVIGVINGFIDRINAQIRTRLSAKFCVLPVVMRRRSGTFGCSAWRDWGSSVLPPAGGAAAFQSRPNDLGRTGPGQLRRTRPPPKDAQGNKLSRTEILNQIKSGLNPSEYAVANPFGPTGAPGALSPYGPMGGRFGGGVVDPQKVLEEQHDVTKAAHELEEDRKNLIAAERSNLFTAEELNDLRWKITEDEWSLQEQQQRSAGRDAGNTKDLASAFGELGAALDPDLGISKGWRGSPIILCGSSGR